MNPEIQFSEQLLSAYSRALIASLREEVESLHLELSNFGINAKVCKYCGAEGGNHKMGCRSIEVRTEPISEAEKTEEGMKALLEEYSKEIYSGHPYRALALSDLIRSHRYLREVNRQNCDFRRDAFQEAYQKGLESAKKSVSEELYVEVAKLREMTLQELAEFLME